MLGNYLAASSKAASGGNYTFLIVIIVLFGLLYFVMIRPQRNRQRQVQQMQNQVQPGQRVRTTAGMYATVVEADDTDVVLEVAPGVHLRFLRRAVMDVLPDEDGTDATAAADTGHAEASSADDVTADSQTPAAHQNGSAPAGSADASAADTGSADASEHSEHTAD